MIKKSVYEDCFDSENKNKKDNIHKTSGMRIVFKKICSDSAEDDDIDETLSKNSDYEKENNINKLSSKNNKSSYFNSVLNEEINNIKKPVTTDNTKTSLISETLLHSMFVAISNVSKATSDILKEPTINNKESIIKDISTSLTNTLSRVNNTTNNIKAINDTMNNTKEIKNTTKNINIKDTTKDINNINKKKKLVLKKVVPMSKLLKK